MDKLTYKTKVINQQTYFVLEFDKNNDRFPEYMIKVNSDYIIQYHRMIKEGNKNIYLFRHVKGQLLSELIKIQKFEEDLILRILVQLIQAIYQIHKQGIEAFQISVYNIILTEDNNILILEYGCYMDTNKAQIMVIAPEYTRQNNSKFNQKQYIKSDAFLIAYIMNCLINQGSQFPYTWDQRIYYEQQIQQCIQEQKSIQIDKQYNDLESTLFFILNKMLLFDINYRFGIELLLELQLFDKIKNIQEIREFYMDLSQNLSETQSEVIYILPQNSYVEKLSSLLNQKEVVELIQFINTSDIQLSQIYINSSQLLIDIHQKLVSQIDNISNQQRLAIVKVRSAIFKQNK